MSFGWPFYVLLVLLSFGLMTYSEHRGYEKGMRAATTALEPHLCPQGAKQ